MNYGYIDKKHILEKAEKICDCIGHGLYGTAVEMIIVAINCKHFAHKPH